MAQAVTKRSTTTSAPEFKLVGAKEFVRHNPKSDKFLVHRFHHFEFYCGDATNTSHRFGLGLGLSLVAKSDQGTGNALFASYVMRSNDLIFSFTAPYGAQAEPVPASTTPLPWFDPETAVAFTRKHGLGVRAVGIVVGDAKEAFEISVANGAVPVQQPVTTNDELGSLTVSEILLYGDVVLRFLSGDYRGHYMPGFAQEVPESAIPRGIGLQRVDHAVGNVPELARQAEYMIRALGFHDFAEFVADDVGTIDSGLNSVVLASNNEMVLLPVNEPTFGTRRKSQIQTYLEQNGGAGLQHLALKTDDIFATLRAMRARTELGGFDFVPRPSDEYYRKLPERIGGAVTPDQYRQVEELGILVDRDDQGILLQIFTKPLGDRPTVFIEIIQRLCEESAPDADSDGGEETFACPLVQGHAPAGEVGGCGGFGKGNFSELFKSIETYETELGIN